MAQTLDELATKLEQKTPAKNGVPDNYEELVKDAVHQLGQDVPLIRTATLSILANQASYDLPADFLFAIELAGLPYSDGTLITPAGLVPVSGGWQETYDISGEQITFYPTPAYAMARTLRYAAGYELVDGEFPRLTENLARIALLYAQHLVYSVQAGAVADKGWKYQIGDEMVDKSNQGKSIGGQADRLLTQYKDAVAKLKGHGSTARYDNGGYWPWV